MGPKNILKITIATVFVFSNSLYCQTSNNFYKINFKSFFKKNDLITNNNIENILNEGLSTSTKSIRVNDSIGIKRAFEFEEIGDKYIKFNNSYIDLATKRYMDFGINFKFQDSLIFTGTQIISPFHEIKANLNSLKYNNKLNHLFGNNNFKSFKEVSTSIVSFRVPAEISKGEFLYDFLSDTIKFIGKSIYNNNGTQKNLISFELEDNIVKNEIGWTNQNNNSKYFLLGRNFLIDRFNLNHTIEINDEIYFDKDEDYNGNNQSIGCKTYNDSLIFIAMRVNSNNKFNKQIQANIKLEISSKEFLNLFSGKNINFETISERDAIVENNLFNNSRYYILVFNVLKNKIIGILNDDLFPFVGIEKLIIDNSNSLLIANYSNGYISIFDIFNFHKIITFTGIAHSIDKNNYLITDPLIYVKYGITGKDVKGKYTNNDYINYISVNKFNLNELKNANISFVKNTDKYDIDEFTTNNDLEKQIFKNILNNADLFILNNSEKKHVNQLKYTKTNSSTSLKCLLSKFDYLDDCLKQENLEYSEQEVVNFSYKFYDQKRKSIVFESNQDLSQRFIEHIREQHHLISQDKIFNEILHSSNHIINYSINRNKGIFSLDPVEINEAKNLTNYNFQHGIYCEYSPLSFFSLIIEKYREEIIKIVPDALITDQNSEHNKRVIICEKHYSRLEKLKN